MLRSLVTLRINEMRCMLNQYDRIDHLRRLSDINQQQSIFTTTSNFFWYWIFHHRLKTEDSKKIITSTGISVVVTNITH